MAASKILFSKGFKKAEQATSTIIEKSLGKIYNIKSLDRLKKLDHKIAKSLTNLLTRDTFFIAVGANDGIKQSNTFFLVEIYVARGFLNDLIYTF